FRALQHIVRERCEGAEFPVDEALVLAADCLNYQVKLRPLFALRGGDLFRRNLIGRLPFPEVLFQRVIQVLQTPQLLRGGIRDEAHVCACDRLTRFLQLSRISLQPLRSAPSHDPTSFRSQLLPGDRLAIQDRRLYKHHVVYIGRKQDWGYDEQNLYMSLTGEELNRWSSNELLVIHRWSEQEPGAFASAAIATCSRALDKGGIRIDPLIIATKGRRTRKHNLCEAVGVDVLLERIQEELGRGGLYSLVLNNCEHFATFLHAGRRESMQVATTAVVLGMGALIFASAPFSAMVAGTAYNALRASSSVSSPDGCECLPHGDQPLIPCGPHCRWRALQ
ncbi:unnamed protein product, partial [Cyprideis torosa]